MNGKERSHETGVCRDRAGVSRAVRGRSGRGTEYRGCAGPRGGAFIGGNSRAAPPDAANIDRSSGAGPPDSANIDGSRPARVDSRTAACGRRRRFGRTPGVARWRVGRARSGRSSTPWVASAEPVVSADPTSDSHAVRRTAGPRARRGGSLRECQSAPGADQRGAGWAGDLRRAQAGAALRSADTAGDPGRTRRCMAAANRGVDTREGGYFSSIPGYQPLLARNSFGSLISRMSRNAWRLFAACW
jgi:hypothetical protein